MRQFYIDTDDGVFRHIDREGVTLADAHAARAAALKVLPALVSVRHIDSDRSDFVATVKDESGMVIYVATLRLAGEWHVHPEDA